MSDVELINRFVDGDIAAFNRLTRNWEAAAFNFIMRYVGDREEAKDLCQKTFIQVYRGLPRLKDRERFSTWFYRIALNTCRDAARVRKRHSLISMDGLEEGELDSVPELATPRTLDPDSVAHRQNVKELLNEALQVIPAEQRVVVVMKEYQGLKFTEIAEVLKVPLNTVKSRMYYGLSALKKVFDRWNIDEEMVRYEL
jgi:RNA polymerase sigma-70 factor (ECF subfamily)